MDTQAWQHNLPEMVMAIFFVRRPGMSEGQVAGGEQQANGVHQRFLQHYPSAQTPVVSLDTTKATDAFALEWPRPSSAGTSPTTTL